MTITPISNSLGGYLSPCATPRDTVLAMSTELSTFTNIGYRVDGLEGYVYPKSRPKPTGTVKLMRKYNPARDDHAVFPETLLTQYTNEGYTATTSTDYLGYVYVNSGTSVPVIQ